MATSTGEPVRVLHIAAPSSVGGLERVLHALAAGHQRRAHDVHVACVMATAPADHPFLKPLHQAGVTVHPIVLPPRAYLAERRRIRELCREIRPDVVHTHSDRTDVVDAGVARKLGIPTVTTVHGSSKMGGKAVLYDWLQQRTYRRFSAVVAVSRALALDALRQGVAPERIHFVPNAWMGEVTFLPRDEARRQLGLPGGGTVLGWVARLIRVKAADVFVRSLALIGDLPWHAAIIGDGPERERLEQLAHEAGIPDRLRFVGAKDEAARYLKAFDVWVMSSRSEGTPIALFEAMAAGIPVVGTAVGGVPDVIGDDAILVPPDNPAALAAGIRRALSDPAAGAERARRAGERLAREYDGERWLASYENVYRAAGAR